jgi:hypothetical protein
MVPAATKQRGEGKGDLRPDSRVRVFSRRQSRPIPAFLSSGVPERAPGDRGWSGLAGWMKAQIRGKMKHRGRDWTIFRCPNEKTAAGGLIGFMVKDALMARKLGGLAPPLAPGSARPPLLSNEGRASELTNLMLSSSC